MFLNVRGHVITKNKIKKMAVNLPVYPRRWGPGGRRVLGKTPWMWIGIWEREGRSEIVWRGSRAAETCSKRRRIRRPTGRSSKLMKACTHREEWSGRWRWLCMPRAAPADPAPPSPSPSPSLCRRGLFLLRLCSFCSLLRVWFFLFDLSWFHVFCVGMNCLLVFLDIL